MWLRSVPESTALDLTANQRWGIAGLTALRLYEYEMKRRHCPASQAR